MKKTIILFFAFILGSIIFPMSMKAQDKTVTLVVSGEAATKDEATKQALRSAIEQAFGTFVSSNTQVLNDELIKDEIVTVTTGNITNYKEISTIKNDDGTTFVTLEATVSIGKLTSFAQSKGMSTELATGTFAMNMKMRELNKKNEIKAISDLQKKLLAMHSEVRFFDYVLNTGEPYLDGECYAVNVTINLAPNKNLFLYRNTIVSTLKALSLSSDELVEYQRANIPVKSIRIRDYNEDDFNVIQVPYPNQNRSQKKYIDIVLRNTDLHYPSLYFPTLLLKNELQFSIKDNIGNEYITMYGTDLDIDDDSYAIGSSGTPVWPLYNFKESYRDKGYESYFFSVFNVATESFVKPIRASYYKMDDDLDIFMWDDRQKSFALRSSFVFKLSYPKNDFDKLSKIDLVFFKPYYVE